MSVAGQNTVTLTIGIADENKELIGSESSETPAYWVLTASPALGEVAYLPYDANATRLEFTVADFNNATIVATR